MTKLEARRLGPELLPGLIALAVFVAWAALEGGFEPTAWYPGGLFLLGLLGVSLATLDRRGSLPRASSFAIALGVAFVVWSFVSIAWADAKGDAWAGANRTLLYVAVFALFALPRWTSTGALALIGTYSVAIAGVAGATLLDAAGASDPTLMFIGDRLAEPTGYHNASAALYLAAALPAAFLASRREVPWVARGVLLAAAGVLVQVAILSQSRGSSIAFPLSLLLFVAIAPNRVRSLAALIPVAAATVVAAPALLDVYSAARDGGDVPAAVDAATRAVAISCGALLIGGSIAALIDRRWRPTRRTVRIGRAVTGTAWGLAGVATIVAALVAVGNPVSWADERWQDFKSGEQELGESRFGGSLGTNRYDFWRVAINEFADSPLGGIGVEQFSIAYARERRSNEEPAYPHSLPVRVVSQTGIVGTLLFGGFLVSALLAALRARRRGVTELTVAAPAVAVVAFGYWFIHSAADWMWAYPALTAPAFAWLGLAGRVADSDPAGPANGPAPDPTEPASARTRRLAIIGALGAAGLVAAASYLLPWAAARDVERAASTWRTDPQAAYDRLDRAAELNFLSERPDLIAGAIAVRRDELPRARDSFARAVDRNGSNWYALLELGAVDAELGALASAREHLARAERLNPSDPVIDAALRAVRAGRPFPLAEIDRRMLARVCQRIGPTEETFTYCE